MNRRFFIHRADVFRQPDTITGRKRNKGLVKVLTDVECLVEPQSSTSVRSQMGRISQASHLLSWGTEDIRDSDVVVWKREDGPDLTLVVGEITADVSRPFSSVPPYHTAELKKQAAT